ncbi:MAG: hypothetical protein KAG97_05185, partial [Victivallales bacterium]|nr:hypothetical protein [Victivallales bacterium]
MRANDKGLLCRLVAGFLVLVSVGAFAKPSAPNLPEGKIKLSKEQVDKCVKVIPAFFKEFKREKTELRKVSKRGASNNVLGALMKSPSKLAKLKKFASKNGYSDFNEFVASLSGVIMSNGYLKLESSEKIIADKLKQLPPQMAAMVKPQIDALKKMKKQYEAKLAPETIQAVAPYVSKLDGIISTGGRRRSK